MLRCYGLTIKGLGIRALGKVRGKEIHKDRDREIEMEVEREERRVVEMVVLDRWRERNKYVERERVGVGIEFERDIDRY